MTPTTRPPAVPTHTLPADGWLATPLRSAGVPFGLEEPGSIAGLRLFRPKPTTIGLFAGPAVSRLLVVRALGAGATVCVITPHPARWARLREQLPGAAARLAVLPPTATVPAGSALPLPALILDEVDGGAPTPRRQLGAWQTSVTAQPQLSPQLLATLRTYDGLVLQRVPEPAAEHVRSATGLSARSARWLPRMPDDVVALISGAEATFTTLAPLPGDPGWLATPAAVPPGHAPHPAQPGQRPGPAQPGQPTGPQPGQPSGPARPGQPTGPQPGQPSGPARPGQPTGPGGPGGAAPPTASRPSQPDPAG